MEKQGLPQLPELKEQVKAQPPRNVQAPPVVKQRAPEVTYGLN